MNIFIKPYTSKLNIYIIDDDEFYMEIIQSKLKDSAIYNIKMFNSMDMCLNEMSLKPADVIIMDIAIEDNESTISLLRTIKHFYKNVHVIIITDIKDVENADYFISQGVTDYVIKNKMTFFSVRNSLSRIRERIILEHKIKNNDRVVKISLGSIIILAIVNIICYFL